MIWTDLVAALVMLSLFFVRSREDIWQIYLVAFLYGTCVVVYQAARSGLLVGMLAGDQLGNANGLLQSSAQASRLVAPLAGAGLYALAGGHAVAALDAATFVVSAGCLLAVRSHDLERRSGSRFWPDLREGLRHIVTTADLRRLTIGTAIVTLVVGMTEVAIFPLIDQGLHRPPTFLGVISSIQGAGSVAAGFAVGAAMRRVGECGRWRSAVVAAVGMTLFGTAALGLVFVASIALGVAITFFNVAYLTLMQRRTSFGMQGRVMSAAEAALTIPYVLSFLMGAAIVAVVPFRTIYLIEAGRSRDGGAVPGGRHPDPGRTASPAGCGQANDRPLARP